MHWMLRFIPLETLWKILCDFLRENWTRRTPTNIDDNLLGAFERAGYALISYFKYGDEKDLLEFKAYFPQEKPKITKS